eukprot:NODE_19661_length_833_cov_3.307365.p1 GENE.NODE_19661_length_833_cov_3.307365~~NODE_19661_length_833_cov_3.307365.p1  ORF type:complete len:166 (-),score=15.38 NODE_19661_length_833_cov_3.307365:311-808(-)
MVKLWFGAAARRPSVCCPPSRSVVGGVPWQGRPSAGARVAAAAAGCRGLAVRARSVQAFAASIAPHNGSSLRRANAPPAAPGHAVDGVASCTGVAAGSGWRGAWPWRVRHASTDPITRITSLEYQHSGARFSASAALRDRPEAFCSSRQQRAGASSNELPRSNKL